jgi:valyl-tRNA synthetase
MVNWDPGRKTTLSDEEVIFEEQQGKLYYIKYKRKRSTLDNHNTSAETILEIVRFVSIQR